MTNQQKKSQAKVLKINPAGLKLTAAQTQVLKILRGRQSMGLISTSTDVAKAWGDKDRSYTYRVLKSLIGKGLIENYSRRYYKIVG